MFALAPRQIAGADVIGPGYAILSCVAVKGDAAMSEPVTRRPPPFTSGCAVCAFLFVWISPGDGGFAVKEMLTWANALCEVTTSMRAITRPNINLDRNVISSPFKVSTKPDSIR
jgi:hypothetical protein